MVRNVLIHLSCVRYTLQERLLQGQIQAFSPLKKKNSFFLFFPNHLWNLTSSSCPIDSVCVCGGGGGGGGGPVIGRSCPKYHFCHNKTLSWQTRVCHDNTCHLSQQKYTCHSKLWSRQTYFCHDKSLWWQNVWWQKWYLWQLPPETGFLLGNPNTLGCPRTVHCLWGPLTHHMYWPYPAVCVTVILITEMFVLPKQTTAMAILYAVIIWCLTVWSVGLSFSTAMGGIRWFFLECWILYIYIIMERERERERERHGGGERERDTGRDWSVKK